MRFSLQTLFTDIFNQGDLIHANFNLSFYIFTGGNISTVAEGPFHDNSFILRGYKWFSSATDAQIAFTLARIVDSEGYVPKVNNISSEMK